VAPPDPDLGEDDSRAFRPGRSGMICREARRRRRRAEVPPSRGRRMPPPLASNPNRFLEDRSEIAHDIASSPGSSPHAASDGASRSR
jgi:hypothetical protein